MIPASTPNSKQRPKKNSKQRVNDKMHCERMSPCLNDAWPTHASGLAWIKATCRTHFRCSLELLGMSPIQSSAANQTKDADEPERFEFPNLDSRIGGDPSWATTLDTLRPSPENGVKNWKWRKEAPVRPVIFDSAERHRHSVVQLHLQHRVVQRLLSRFTAQGFVLHDLSRACLAHSKDYIPLWSLIGRLSIYGTGAARLHEEILTVHCPLARTQQA